MNSDAKDSGHMLRESGEDGRERIEIIEDKSLNRRAQTNFTGDRPELPLILANQTETLTEANKRQSNNIQGPSTYGQSSAINITDAESHKS
jgi:hypothetical protein